MRKCFLTLVVLAIANGGAWYAYPADQSDSTTRSTTVATGDTKKITALGTVEPEKVVEVFAQVPGMIMSLGHDPHTTGEPIDYGSSVEAGSVLAMVDPSVYMCCVEQEQARCAVGHAELAQAQAKLELAEAQWQLAQTGRDKGTISQSDFLTAKFNCKIAKAAVTAAEAALLQNEAASKEARCKLDYTTIKSPIKGVVIDRRVNVGQMAIVSPNPSCLFLIADLKNLQIWASVNEADISQIHQQQPVRFTVAAYPSKVFEGKVQQIRLNATMTQNVVTYTVVVAISSATEKLLPYMTAHLEFE